MNEQDLLATLDALGVSVAYARRLPDDRVGEYHHRRRLIRLERGMPRRLHRSVLAHECAHAVFEDVPSPFGPANARQERRADQWAARHLIALSEYCRAELLHEGHTGGMAVELDVTTDLVETYRALLHLAPLTEAA
ncbi:ImmA/IrrE family metallo-endopeptidase [Microbacterium sp. X-17]|uniref:ImmA/IrrE family metallo-endopeptidase n=1 Tax=Microbacterium sp. X-17 TaxID=3144404 RepID=UPI0031F4D41D